MMQLAIEQAQLAEQKGEVPVGAVVVKGQTVIASAHNQVITSNQAAAHAEIIALQQAGKKLGNYRLPECELYVTLEPCMMCAGALVHARIKRLIFGAYDYKTGVISTVDNCFDRSYHNHRVQWQGGILEQPCGQLLSDFFKRRRAAQKSQSKTPAV